MSGTLGWKDILRPIRNGYRHLFPSPDIGPTPEEREKKRDVDRLKGFTYFDTFDRLDDWTEAEADPIQRSNTPLLLRPSVGQASRDPTPKAKVLLCHDYTGNYHDYEAVQGAEVDEEMYSCEYLQFVDTFIYFSHKLACVPPPSWTNTLHRNGVKVLGTFLVEPQTKGFETLLRNDPVLGHSDKGVFFPLAGRLADIAKFYGFDGWLVNIEKPFPKETWDPKLLEGFLEQLRDSLGAADSVIWYDAVTAANKVDYQNALTHQNLSFSNACGSILTNYAWKEKDAWDSKVFALENEVHLENIFFGVDVWAQNPSKLTQPRITFPERGGGGTNTGVAAAKLAEVGLSVGVFAPAWSFEHFPTSGREIERTMWDGEGLPDGMECSCGDCNSRHAPNRDHPITYSAIEYPAGSERFFYTDFSRSFSVREIIGQSSEQDRKTNLRSQLGSQTVLPHFSRAKVQDDSINVLSPHIEDLPGHSHLVIDIRGIPAIKHALDETRASLLPLFKMSMPADGSLLIRVRCQYFLRAPTASASIYLKFTEGRRLIPLLLQVEGIETIEVPVRAESRAPESNRLEEIGFHLEASELGEDNHRLAEIKEISIIPRDALTYVASCTIDDLCIEHRGSGETSHWRLCWQRGVPDDKLARHGIPYSEITGTFSYFMVYVGKECLGRAYALEFVLPRSAADELAGEGAFVKVVGIGFDGKPLAENTKKLQIR